jgi:hypothetical protein
MTGAHIDPVGDDEHHSKLVYFARRSPRSSAIGSSTGGESR